MNLAQRLMAGSASRLYDDFRPNTGRVAHRYADYRFFGYRVVVCAIAHTYIYTIVYFHGVLKNLAVSGLRGSGQISPARAAAGTF